MPEIAVRPPRIPRRRWAVAGLLLAAAYVVSPVDAIPDLPPLGWLDDALVVAAALAPHVRRARLLLARLSTRRGAPG